MNILYSHFFMLVNFKMLCTAEVFNDYDFVYLPSYTNTLIYPHPLVN